MIKAILYDLDGVLVDACDWHYEALNDALEEVGSYRINREDHLSKYNGLPTRVKLAELARLGHINESDIDLIFNRKQELTISTIEKHAVFAEDKVKLHAYTSSLGVKSACVTNAIRETAAMMLKRTGQLPFMDFILSNEDVTKQKPDPEPYLTAMNKMGLSPEEVLIVEDSDKGYASAIATGARVVRVAGCSQVNEESAKQWLKEIK